MKYLIGLLAAVALATPLAASSAPGSSCKVQQGLSAAMLNAGGTWSFEAFGFKPGHSYHVKVNWAGDPSNNAHPNADIGPTDSNGYAIQTYPAYWSVDGFLPGIFNPDYQAVPGNFTVQVYNSTTDGSGNAKCKGSVGP